MLEKSSRVILTNEEIRQYTAGVVPERIKQTWGIESIDELRELLSNQFTEYTKKDES